MNYQLERSSWKNKRTICYGINEERLDEDYDNQQFDGAFDDFDTFDVDFMEEN